MCDLGRGLGPGRWPAFPFIVQFREDAHVLSPFIKLPVRCAEQFPGFQEHEINRNRIEKQDRITGQPNVIPVAWQPRLAHPCQQLPLEHRKGGRASSEAAGRPLLPDVASVCTHSVKAQGPSSAGLVLP